MSKTKIHRFLPISLLGLIFFAGSTLVFAQESLLVREENVLDVYQSELKDEDLKLWGDLYFRPFVFQNDDRDAEWFVDLDSSRLIFFEPIKTADQETVVLKSLIPTIDNSILSETDQLVQDSDVLDNPSTTDFDEETTTDEKIVAEDYESNDNDPIINKSEQQTNFLNELVEENENSNSTGVLSSNDISADSQLIHPQGEIEIPEAVEEKEEELESATVVIERNGQPLEITEENIEDSYPPRSNSSVLVDQENSSDESMDSETMTNDPISQHSIVVSDDPQSLAEMMDPIPSDDSMDLTINDTVFQSKGDFTTLPDQPKPIIRGISEAELTKQKQYEQFRLIHVDQTAQKVSDQPFAKDRFILKLKSSSAIAPECANCVLPAGAQLKANASNSMSSLELLNEKFGVKQFRKMFTPLTSESNNQPMSAELPQIPGGAATVLASSSATNTTNPPVLVSALDQIYLVDVPAGTDIATVSSAYAQDENVEFAQPDYRHRPYTNDTFYSLLWGINNTGQFVYDRTGTADADIDAPEAWALNEGNGVVVAVVDTGVDYTHVDLDNNIWTNGDEIVNGVDSDGNGYVDDIRGWDFGDGDNNPMDQDGHGTHVAGIIAAEAGNSEGVVGVAPKVKIMVVKGFEDSGDGYTSDLANAIVYAALNGADVINNSWGCIDPCPSDPTAEAAVRYAYGLGVVVVFAAGNENEDVANYSPQNMSPETITVAASDQDDAKASFSNYGNLIDVAAPGFNIASTYPTSLGGYVYLDGTSMASPHVAGVAALTLSYNSALSLTNTQVRTILRKTADDILTAGFDTSSGAGRVNAYQAVTLVKVRPVLNAIGNQSVLDGSLLQFTTTATDPNSDALTHSAIGLPAGATYTDHGDDTATFSWTPATGGSVAAVTFKVQDADGFYDTETITITVQAAVCGNGSLEGAEECDDGNTANGDGCDDHCLNESCGDGVVDPSEQCDDGNGVSGDGCSSLCRLEVCGNDFVDVGEECDDGNVVDGDGCTALCVDEFCGDGVVNDDGVEQCDDGGVAGGDGCSATCIREECQNGILDPGEECDDGNAVDGDGCTALCVDEYCGDGIVNDSGVEQCDDGANVGGDGCSAVCIREECGNGVVDPGEECDDLNTANGDGCNATCALEGCGNSVVDVGEECDDGNSDPVDGCKNDCTFGPYCGDHSCDIDDGENCSNCRTDCGYCRGLRPR